MFHDKFFETKIATGCVNPGVNIQPMMQGLGAAFHTHFSFVSLTCARKGGSIYCKVRKRLVNQGYYDDEKRKFEEEIQDSVESGEMKKEEADLETFYLDPFPCPPGQVKYRIKITLYCSDMFAGIDVQ